MGNVAFSRKSESTGSKDGERDIYRGSRQKDKFQEAMSSQAVPFIILLFCVETYFESTFEVGSASRYVSYTQGDHELGSFKGHLLNIN